jgi:sortase (surface protein transpeptidase)
MGWRVGKAAATLIMAGLGLGVGGWQAAPAAPEPAQPVPAQTGLVDIATTRTSIPEIPTRLRIPVLEVDVPLVELGLDSAGALSPPTDFDVPGWYAGGTRPGQIGPAVIAGHVDSLTGPAVFVRLHELQAGDLVEVASGDRWLRFVVRELGWYPKDRFPTELVYGPTPDAQLRLITCGGGYDTSRRSYTDNLVVYAVAA